MTTLIQLYYLQASFNSDIRFQQYFDTTQNIIICILKSSKHVFLVFVHFLSKTNVNFEHYLNISGFGEKIKKTEFVLL